MPKENRGIASCYAPISPFIIFSFKTDIQYFSCLERILFFKYIIPVFVFFTLFFPMQKKSISFVFVIYGRNTSDIKQNPIPRSKVCIASIELFTIIFGFNFFPDSSCVFCFFHFSSCYEYFFPYQHFSA